MRSGCESKIARTSVVPDLGHPTTTGNTGLIERYSLA
jgi:hypothetical protein